VVLAEGDTIGVDEFPQIALLGASETPLVPEQGTHAAPPGNASPGQSLLLQPGDDTAAQPGNLNNLPIGAMLPLLDAAGDVLALEAIEAAAIRFAIAHYRGQMSEVARKLRIGRSTLYRKIEHLGLAEGPGEADVSGR
jgi:DNA-binding NtrC family response regulator